MLILPHDKEAEQGLLGYMLRHNEALDHVAMHLRSSDFYQYAHRKIFEIFVDVGLVKGTVIDVVILSDEIKSRNLVEEIGGYSYLAHLWEAAPAIENCARYVEIIAEKSLRRRVIQLAISMQLRALDLSAPIGTWFEECKLSLIERKLSIEPEPAQCDSSVQASAPGKAKTPRR